MLISKNVKIKWNSKIKKHYVNLGYTFTKMGDSFDVDVKDLTHGSSVRIMVKCDYCGREYEITYDSYVRLKQKQNNTDCCDNPNCTAIKSSESLLQKYGTSNIREIPNVNEKIEKTNLKKYGCANPFGNKSIQNKIKYTNRSKYGCDVPTQNSSIVQKSKKTCIEKYWVDNYSKTAEFRESMRGSNSPVYKGNNVQHERTERNLPEYRDWRKAVFARDNYTCQHCGKKNGFGESIYLECHHLNCFKDFECQRLDVDNGITLCKQCHMLFHSLYGKKHTTKEQFEEFQNNNDNNTNEKNMLN